MDMTFKSKASILRMLGENIRSERLTQNLTQPELSERSGVAFSTLRKLEATGEASMKDYVNVLIALGKVNELNHFLVPVSINPEAIFKAKGKKRTRATGSRRTTH